MPTAKDIRNDYIKRLTTQIEGDLNALLTLCPEIAHAKSMREVDAVFSNIRHGESDAAATLLHDLEQDLLFREIVRAHAAAEAEAEAEAA